jgi:hypothetical protein
MSSRPKRRAIIKLITAPINAPATEYTVPIRGPKKAPAAISSGRLGMGLITTAEAITAIYIKGARFPAPSSQLLIRSGLKYAAASQNNWEQIIAATRIMKIKLFILITLFKIYPYL